MTGSGQDGGLGSLLRDWRGRRHLSQLDLALSADVSARHLSFLETGRARPSRSMILRLAEALDVPLATRNELLEAGGFVASYSRAGLDDDTLAPVRTALTRLMRAHMPYPAVLFTRHWDVVDSNLAGRALFGGAPAGVNAIELLLDDEGLRARIINLGQTLRGIAGRLKAESRHVGGDPRLDALVVRLLADPAVAATPDDARLTNKHPFLPVRFRADHAELVLFSATAEIGTAQAIALRDLHLELSFPGDAATDAFFQRIGGAASQAGG